MFEARPSLVRFLKRALGVTKTEPSPELGIPWDSTLMAGGGPSKIYHTDRGRLLTDAGVEQGAIYLSQLYVENPSSGLGTDFMLALKEYALAEHTDIYVYKVTNPEFFRRFDWLEERNRDFKFNVYRFNQSRQTSA